MHEIALRLRAAMKHYGLTDADVPGLYVIAANHWGLPLLRGDGYRALLDRTGVDALAAELDHTKPDVVIIDPLINVMGGANANDNAAAALLMGHLAGLAVNRRIAVALAHHTSKGRDLTSAESAMGAASFINLARTALAIEPLDP
jgi:RecA-family ATPase